MSPRSCLRLLLAVLAAIPGFSHAGGRETEADAPTASAPAPYPTIPVAAPEPPPEEPHAPAPAATELEMVTVTAQRIPQDEREVPHSIAVISRRRMEEAHITTPDELSRDAANTVFSDFQLYVRGIGTANSFGFEPSVAVFMDGVYLGRATASLMPLMDFAQVEVIRGPQGTLLGKNTIGGALSITTADAEPLTSGEIQGLHGELDPYGLRAVASVPFGDDWGLRLAHHRDDTEGHVHNSTQDIEVLGLKTRAARAKLAWRPGGRTSAWLSIEDAESNKLGFGQQLSVATPETLALYRLYDPATETRTDYHASLDAPGTGGFRTGHSATLQVAHAFGGIQVSSLSNVVRSDFAVKVDADFSPVPLITLDLAEDYAQWSQELRANGSWSDVDYIAGAYFSRARLNLGNLAVVLPNGSAGLVTGLLGEPELIGDLLRTLGLDITAVDPVRDESRKDFHQKSRSAALYGQLTWNLTTKWQLTAGLRWTRERKELEMANTFSGSGLVFQQFLGEEPYVASREREEEDFSPKLAVQYAWTPRVTLYAAAARGFKGGGFNDVAPRSEVLEFEEERSDNFEIGGKTLFLGRRLAVNLAIFDSRLDDLQVNAFEGTSYYVRNAARVKSRGVELDSRWRIGGFSAFASLGYLDGRYASFPNAPPRADQQADSQDLSGARLARAPERSGVVGLAYASASFGPGLLWSASVDAQYRDHMFLNLDNDPIDAQPAYTLWNAALGIGGASGGWLLRLSGYNLADTLTRKEAGDVPLFAGNHYVTVEEPRRYLLALALRW